MTFIVVLVMVLRPTEFSYKGDIGCGLLSVYISKLMTAPPQGPSVGGHLAGRLYKLFSYPCLIVERYVLRKLTRQPQLL